MRRVAIVLGLLVLGAGVFLYPTLWGRPWSIDHFFERVFLEFALERPLLLSQLRILEPYGIDFHADDLADYSVAFARDEIRKVNRNLEILRGYDFSSLDETQRRSAQVLEWFFTLRSEQEPFLLYDYPVNQMNGVQKGLPDFMINVHQIRTEEDAENYRLRLSNFDDAFGQIVDGLEARRDIGVVPPSFVLDQVRREIDDFVSPPPIEHILYQHLAIMLEHVEDLSDERRDELLGGTLAAIEGSVYPGYRLLGEKLAELQEVATEDAGVWKFPHGEEYYAWLLRQHTTTRLTADEIHQLGLAEVARLRKAIRAILEREGLPADDLAETLGSLALNPRFRYPDTDEGRAELLADYEAIVAEARAKLPEMFGRLPRAEVVVERLPEFMEEGAAGASYRPPPFDGSRPGVFYVNLRNVLENPRFRMRTLAHHEALPGHHLQIALAQEQEDAPFFRRVMRFTAFSEGWALYAERMAGEHGLLPTPADELGSLVDELFRAVRLVVDTGIHAKRWTRAEAIAYMRANTGKPQSEVQAEVDRYIVMPGQATAYKVGQLQILAYRERARQALGDRFDLRGFHDAVLGGGAVPLEILEAVVQEWVASVDARS